MFQLAFPHRRNLFALVCFAVILCGVSPGLAADFRITSIRATNNDIRLNWNAPGGSNYVLQVVTPLSSNFVDLGPSNYVPNGNDQTLGYTHLGARTSTASRYYRVKAFPAPPKLEIQPTNAVIGVGMTNRYKIFLVYPDNSRVDVTSSAAVTSADAKIARYTRTADGFAYVRGDKTGNVSVRAAYQGISNSVVLVVSTLNGISVEPPFPINGYVEGSSTSVRVMGTFANGQTLNITPSSTFDGGIATRVDFNVAANVANSFALVTGQSAASYNPPFMAGGFQVPLTVDWCNFTSLSFVPQNPHIKVGETLTMSLYGQGPGLSGDALSPSFNGTRLNDFYTFDSSSVNANFGTRSVTGVAPGTTTLFANIDSGPGSFCSGALSATTTITVYCPDDELVDTSYSAGSGPNLEVQAIAVQPDGKAIVGGSFTTVNGIGRGHIARLNANGSVDTSFNPGTGANDNIYCVALQPDGRILIGGTFTSVNGTNRNGIARLSANGSLDTSFDPGAGTNDVYSIAIQPDGQVLIAGLFTTVNGTALNRIARLNYDGTVDFDFTPGTGANGLVRSVAVQGDGKILIGGDFTTFNGTARSRIARLDSGGALDLTFNPGPGADASVYSLTPLPGGKVLMSGAFSTVNNFSRSRIARLNSSGSVDTSFSPSVSFNSLIYSHALQPDGKILVGGLFTSAGTVTRNRLARLSATGGLDADLGLCGANSILNAIAVDPCRGYAYIGGNFTQIGSVSRSRIARLPVPPATTPVNDSFAGRILLPGLQPTAAADNTCASKEPGEPQHAGNTGGKSLWWSWVAPVSGIVTIGTCGSGFDTLLAVYAGDTVDGLSPISSDDDASCFVDPTLQSQVEFQTIAGTTYHIAVDGYLRPNDMAAASGFINLTINFQQTYYAATFEAGLDGCAISNAVPPGNGLWHRSTGRGADNGHSPSNSLYYGQGETLIGGGTYNTGSSNAGAFVSPVINLAGVSAPVFLKFNYLLATEAFPPYDKAQVEVSANNGPFQNIADNQTNDIQLADFQSANFWTSALLDLSSFVGQQVRLRFFFNTVDAAQNSFEGWYVDDLSVVGPVSGANDNFANRVNLSGRTTSTLGNNSIAGKQVGETNHTGNAGGASVWWSWTAPSTGIVTIKTCGSDFDTLLAVYTGTAVTSLTLIADNDDAVACGVGSVQSQVQFTATAGVTYQIAVDGYKYPDEPAARTGTIVLTIQQ